MVSGDIGVNGSSGNVTHPKDASRKGDNHASELSPAMEKNHSSLSVSSMISNRQYFFKLMKLYVYALVFVHLIVLIDKCF